MARGLSSREIATSLSITERTAENHVEHILTRLGFRSRAQIAAWAVEYGLANAPLPEDERDGTAVGAAPGRRAGHERHSPAPGATGHARGTAARPTRSAAVLRHQNRVSESSARGNTNGASG